MNKNRLVIVDDETDMRNGLQRLLSREFPGLQIVTLPDAEHAIAYFDKDTADLALLDIMMPRMNGLDLLRCLMAKDPWLTAVMMTGFGSIATAVEAIKLGAIQYLTKPTDAVQILEALHQDEGNPQVDITSRNFFRTWISHVDSAISRVKKKASALAGKILAF